MSSFAETMRRLRFERHMTQEEFADLLGTTKQNISRYESGAVSPKISTAKAIADKLGISLSELSGDTSSDGTKQKLHDIGQQLTAPSRSDAYKSLKSELSSIKFALLGEIEDMTDEEIQDMWDYHRFKRAQKAKQEEKP